MSIGKTWSESLRADAAATDQERADRLRCEVPPNTPTICVGIPERAEEAIRAGKDSIMAMPRVLSARDFASGNPDQTWHDVGWKNAHRGHDISSVWVMLDRDEMTGEALVVYDWCADNDLECFLARDSDGWLGYAYELRAIPRL